jgi:hypothetical protein
VQILETESGLRVVRGKGVTMKAIRKILVRLFLKKIKQEDCSLWKCRQCHLLFLTELEGEKHKC